MTARFVRLRIAGFKSFADPVVVDILPGLTGIVGPNGCGKSNVVEALRWAMGESSARSLRGGEMDDLIFAGTTARPARSLAEVSLTLEGAAGVAPAPHHENDELEITRRAERGAGSDYRINGKSQRARDIQTLFADLASGARSSAMVSQGRVSALVNARPDERRSILEEAAGITGLHARRHEAELKLRATETNLGRAEDLRLQLEGQLEGLVDQSKQAGRYREISAALRESEISLLALLHARARQAVERAGQLALQARHAMKQAEAAAEDSIVAEFEANKALPALRDAADACRTTLERQRVAAEGVAQEEARATHAAEESQARLAQAETDFAAAESRLHDAMARSAALENEQREIEERLAALPALQAEAADARASAEGTIAADTQALEQAMAAAAQARSQVAALRTALDDTGARVERLSQQQARLEAERAALLDGMPQGDALDALARSVEDAQAALETAREAARDTTRIAAETARAADNARAALAEAERLHKERTQAVADLQARLTRLEQERARLDEQVRAAQQATCDDATLTALATALSGAEAQMEAAAAGLDQAELQRAAATTARVDARAALQEAAQRREAAIRARDLARTAQERAAGQRARLQKDFDEASRNRIADAVMEDVRTARADAESAFTQADTAATDMARQEAERAEAHAAAQQALLALQSEAARLSAEAEGLTQALAGEEGTEGFAPIADSLTVPEGLERAIAAALSVGLDASVDQAAPRQWRAGPDGALPSLPDGVVCLRTLVEVPPVLARAFDAIGIVRNESEGDALQVGLQPGQSLVTREGALWRWDGYRVRAGLPDPAAQRLSQRLRLRQAETALETANTAIVEADRRFADSQSMLENARAQARMARDRRGACDAALAQARAREADTSRQFEARRARFEAIAPQYEQAVAADDDARARFAAAESDLAALANTETLKAAVTEAEAVENRAREAETRARSDRAAAEKALAETRGRDRAVRARHEDAIGRLNALAPAQERTVQDAAEVTQALADANGALAETAAPAVAQQARRAADEAVQHAVRAQTEAEAALSGAESTLEATRSKSGAMQTARLERQSRIEALAPGIEAVQSDLASAQTMQQQLQADAAATPDVGLLEREVEAIRARLTECRAQESAARSQIDLLTAEQTTLISRQSAIVPALAENAERSAAATQERDSLAQRAAMARETHSRLSALPDAAQRQRDTTLAALAEAEAAWAKVDTARAAGEQACVMAQVGRRDAEAALSKAREEVVRAEGRGEQANAVLEALLAESPPPPGVVPTDLTEGAESSLRRKISRLTREREDMGPVNLRAELEANSARDRMETIVRERGELESAIAKLRGSIGALNREGRERLMAVFKEVDGHFQSLFTRMFGGGKAHLAMVGDDDPLMAGLEIYAQPPGKKLATLSLLSGGEQALTALSLIFAVFRCNPAPVCVLDEVDAPLDDANVGRFCALLGDMVAEAGTRFLVVTHHQLTMAHMDRLFGVTMQERGVSRVLSVDLGLASEMAGHARLETPDVLS